ncbi:SpoIIE family protein phosphatase [Leptospira sp. 201903070]|uniref:SpoIIE family protein phosphatase n=1 Tax=Leptospira ainlahdjerensis TaxID=2810033 RepID=A0ABS2UH71_9LEPT|nr:SpoIIE family protein phosphatase [Leptospira ainlahdjerensis]MBM9579504.1 SpoIIE family protein phosphatase [Leptospira ainlahdjerensis]
MNHQFRTFAYTFILILLTQTSLFSQNSIDLTKNCDQEENCGSKGWKILDRFENRFLEERFVPDSEWKNVPIFPIWVNKFYSHNSSLHRFTFYTEFDLPDRFAESPLEPGIRFGEIGETFEIYINGKIIAKEGEVSKEKVIFHRTVRGQVYEIDREVLKSKGNRLVVKISGDPKYDHTGFYLTSGYEIGYYKELIYKEQDRIALILIGIYITTGLYHLFLFLKRRKERHNFSFGLFALLLGLYIYTRSSVVFENPIDSTLIQRIELIGLYICISSYFTFMSQLFYGKTISPIRYYSVFNVLLVIPTLFTPMYISEYLLRVWQMGAIFYAVPVNFYVLIKGIRLKLPAAKRLFLGTVIITFTAIFDVLDSLFFNTGLALSKYGFFFYVMGIATILAERFSELHAKTEELNANLEQRVEERTRELTDTLDKMSKLKDQQDGDYFLTSLLINPLGQNNAKSENVKIEFFIKQKKQFQFKNLRNEIGGDLCKTESIVLKGRRLTVFFNADAMGKSMQGAGGALVLGAVFKSIIERTRFSAFMKDLYPERWLKNAFIELHRVFESFEGSMLVSIVLGVIEDDTGFTYYMNAEHPYSILYRDGIASFLGENVFYRKLGSQLVEGTLSVQTFQFLPGDVLFNGSDGRDDILLENIDGKKNMNYDETRILRIVEESQGNLERINSQLEREGVLTDDLSIMKIEWNGTVPKRVKIKLSKKDKKSLDKFFNEIGDGKQTHPAALKELSFAYFRLREYDKAAFCAYEYLKAVPSDDKMLGYTSRMLRKAGEIHSSVDVGERLRIRDPKNVQNLRNLIRAYKGLNNSERILKLEEILSATISNQKKQKSIPL